MATPYRRLYALVSEKRRERQKERDAGERGNRKRPCTLGDRALKHLTDADSCSLAAKPTSAAALDCTGPARPGR